MWRLTDLSFWTSCVMALLVAVQAFVELPKFNQLQLLYPGYFQEDGKYRNRDIPALVGGNHTNPLEHLHNTSPLRMSITLNRYGGRHAIGTQPITLPEEGLVSVRGQDDQEYIFSNTAFGPFLAGKYGNPDVSRPHSHDSDLRMKDFEGKQGIVRFVSYHKDHAGGHIGLWDCDHFFQSPDWSMEHHMISVEFWETPDSYCPPKVDNSIDLQELLQNYRLVPIQSEPPSEQEINHDGHNSLEGTTRDIEVSTRHKVRHSHKRKKPFRLKDLFRRNPH